MKAVKCAKCGEVTLIHLRRNDRPPALEGTYMCHLCGGQLKYDVGQVFTTDSIELMKHLLEMVDCSSCPLSIDDPNAPPRDCYCADGVNYCSDLVRQMKKLGYDIGERQ